MEHTHETFYCINTIIKMCVARTSLFVLLSIRAHTKINRHVLYEQINNNCLTFSTPENAGRIYVHRHRYE